MTNKTTKRALLTSVMALFLCFTMLLGTTFAWFTDSVTSANNKIIAGTLDVDLFMWNGDASDEDNRKEITETSAPIFGANSLVAQNNAADTLWEPGKTQVVYLSIKNNGNLALKYQVALEAYGETNNLLDVLEYTITNDAKFGSVTEWAGDGVKVKEGINATQADSVVLESGNEHFFALSIHMDENAGNDYQKGEVNFDLTVLATQLASEEDSFNNKYDEDATFPVNTGATAPVDSNATEIVVEIKDNTTGKTIGTVTVPKAALANDVTEVAVTVKGSETPDGITLESNQGAMTLDIDVSGLKEGNTEPVEVSIFYAKGLNNVKLYHNEERIVCSYNAESGYITFSTTSFSPFTAVYAYEPIPEDEWDGTADTSWYNDTNTVFFLSSAEQLAGLADLVDGGNTFENKTIALDSDVDLYVEDENGEPISFEPIGSFSDNLAFKGVFDGQGHTVSNLYQNGWALQNGYWDGPEYGMGLFSLVENAVIKNVNFDGASLPSEANIMGVVAGGAANCVFENINITDAYLGNHSWYSGGAIGWAEGDVKLINCDIDASSVVSSQWGDFNNANGGLIGGIDPASTIYLKDCDVACVIDAYNDVTSAYEWYSYRNCGMLIGDTGQKDDPDGDNVGNAIAPNLTCENVTVTYGDWTNYHYCEFRSAGYPFCRVEAGESTGAYGNARVGEYFDANGNKVVDDNHVHNDCEKHNELIVFDQLYGGETGDRYCTYGTATHDGVNVIYNNK